MAANLCASSWRTKATPTVTRDITKRRMNSSNVTPPLTKIRVKAIEMASHAIRRSRRSRAGIRSSIRYQVCIGIIISFASRGTGVRSTGLSPNNGQPWSMSLDAARDEIRKIDEEIIDLVAERQRLAAEIVRLKQENGLSIRDEAQRRAVLDRAFSYAAESRIDPVAVRKIFEVLVEMNEERQRECSGDGSLP